MTSQYMNPMFYHNEESSYKTINLNNLITEKKLIWGLQNRIHCKIVYLVF